MTRRENPVKAGSSEQYALLSVSDKTGIADFARILSELGFRIISTGGTAKALTDNGIPVIPIRDITGNPESFDGRMKTISFQVESGILYDRQNPRHRKEARALGIKDIDIVVTNLYPFEETVGKRGVRLSEAVESVDVGGPTMVRSAAKNFKNVLVVVDPSDYSRTARALKSGQVTTRLRQDLAAKAFRHLSLYDAQIAHFLGRDLFPEEIALPGRRTLTLRYGENPHQKAAVYLEPNTNSPLASLQKLTGRDLSYVNFTDIASGLESVRMFKEAAAVVIKHNSPAGVAIGKTPSEALTRAVAADPVSAFGGVIVLNKVLDLSAAETFAGFKEEDGVVVDIVAAPRVTKQAEKLIRSIRKTTGIYTFGRIPHQRSDPRHVRFFDGGFIIEDWDEVREHEFTKWQVMGKYKPTKKQMEQMKIAWKFIGRVHSNSIIVVDYDLPMTRGIGSGQTSRVGAARIALEQARKHTEGAILASDSFFPFNDVVKLAERYKIGAIVQQGGSINDKASIEAADKAGIPMVATGERKFWH